MATGLPTDAEAFEAFLRDQLAGGDRDRSPEELLQQWRRSQGEGEGRQPNSESFFDQAERAGLIGCISTGAGDLSTNPKHLEGFGEN